MPTIQQAYALFNENRLEEALAAFQQIIAANPRQSQAHFGLGQLFLQIEEFDRAIEHLNACCSQQADNYQALITLASAFEAVNSHEDVATLYTYILSKFSHVPQVRYQSGLYYSQIGNKSAAIEHIEACLTLLQDANLPLLQAHAWLLLIKLDKSTHSHENLARLKQLITHLITQAKDSNAQQVEAAMVFEYACADIYETLGKHEAAFACWTRANASGLKRCLVSTQQLCDFMHTISKAEHPVISSLELNNSLEVDSSHELNNNPEKNTEFTPIFIVGLARTGSTLLEQLLSQHSNVDTMGEVTIISQQVAKYFSRKYQLPYPEFLAHLSKEDCAIGAKIYIRAVRKRQLNAAFVIDKLPANFQSLSLINAIFPHAKIIHLQRDSSQVALSTFKHYFAHNEPNFCDLANMQNYHKAYLALMDFWQQDQGIACMNITYEELVSDPKTCIDKVMAYCKLPKQTLNVSKDNQTLRDSIVPIKTLSALQVRTPISNKPLYATSPYKKMLAAFGID